MKTGRNLLLLSLLAAVLAAGALLLSATGDAPVTRQQRAEVVIDDLPEADPAAERTARNLRAGDCARYRFALKRGVRSRISADLKVHGRPAQPIELDARYRVNGEMDVRIHTVGSNGWTGSVSLHHVEADMLQNGDRVEGEWDRYASMLKGEVGLRVDGAGRIAGLRFPAAMHDHGRRLVMDLLEQWQVVRAAHGADEWTVEGSDSTGKYRARYRRLSAAGEQPERLERAKIAYDSLMRSGDSFLELAPTVGGNATIAADRLPIHIDADEKVELDDEANSAFIHLTLRFSCERVSVQNQPIDTDLDRHEAEVAFGAGVAEATVRTLNDAELRAAFDSALAPILLAGEDEEARARAQFSAMQKIVDLLHEQGERATDMIREQLESGRVHGDDASLLVGCLGAAGTDSSQGLLRDLMTEDRWSPAIQERAVFAVAAVQKPIPEMDDTLREIHERGTKNAGSALLLLAANGNKVRAENPERAAEIEKYVLAKLQRNIPENELVTALEAIGNLGPATVPAIVRDAVRDPLENTRLAALHALERIPAEDADKLLAESAELDPSEEAREEAKRIIERRAAAATES